MSDPKSEAFHRLARQRVDKILDAYRIFSNLAGPSYSWTREEVLSYLAELHQGLDEAKTRFRDNRRRWGVVEAMESGGKAGDVPTYVPADAPHPPDSPRDERGRVTASQAANAACAEKYAARQLAIGEIIREAGACRETLAEMIVLQREVIEQMEKRG